MKKLDKQEQNGNDRIKILFSKKYIMKKYIYLFVASILLTGCYELLHISYDLDPQSYLKKVYPNIYIQCYVNTSDSIKLSINFPLEHFDSIKVIKLIPVLNKKDTMYLISGNYNKIFERYTYEFYNSDLIINYNSLDLIIDCIFFKKDQSRRYTDTLFIKERDRIYKHRLNYIFPRLH